MSDQVFEIEGDLGELDYGGITLNAVDTMVEFIAEGILAPEMRRRINRITGATEESIKVKREGFFDPRRGVASGVGPTWSVYTNIGRMPVLEYGYGGRNAVMRPAARARRVKTAIRNAMQLRFGKEMRIQVRNAKRKKKRK